MLYVSCGRVGAKWSTYESLFHIVTLFSLLRGVTPPS